jgi:hypothetical protein
MLRWNPHYHTIVLEGGFDQDGTFFFIPISDLTSMTELFRRRVLALLVDRKVLDDQFARNLMSWKHSGFSIDNSVRILDHNTQESLSEYIARPPISLKKIRYEPFKGRVLFHTTYSDYFKENVHLFDALDFLAELTQHLPPKGVRLIRRYGLYASRTKGRWGTMPFVAERAPAGWQKNHPDPGRTATSEDTYEEIELSERKQTWAKLIAKVYEVDLLVCPKCGWDMKVVAVIEDPC